jgi:hypothetical protein
MDKSLYNEYEVITELDSDMESILFHLLGMKRKDLRRGLFYKNCSTALILYLQPTTGLKVSKYSLVKHAIKQKSSKP